MSDVKVEIGTGQQFCGVRVLQDFHISHMPQEFARIYSYEDYLSDSGVAEPTAQPTSLVFSSVGENQMTLSWTAASPAVDGYIVLRSTAAISDVPVDLTNYNVGDTIGSSTVEFLGAGLTFVDSSLSAYTTYYYAVFSYNGASGTYNFLTTAPLTGNQITLYDFVNKLHFDGSNDVVTGSNTSFLSNRTTYTVCGWVEFDTTATDQIIFGYTLNNSGRGVGLMYITATGRLRCLNSPVGTGAGYLETPLGTPTSKHHVGYVFDNAGAGNTDKIKIYIDGALIASPISFGTITTTGVFGGAAKFGASVSTRFLDGHLDDWAMWSDALASHITNHYNSGTGATPDASNRIMWLKFDESNPVTACTDETGGQTWTASNFNGDANSGSVAA